MSPSNRKPHRRRMKVLFTRMLLITLLLLQFDGHQRVTAETVPFWHIETVNTIYRCFDTPVSLAISDPGVAHISYQDIDAPATLIHSYRSGSGWISEAVDNAEGAGKHNSLALDSLGYPHISYRNGLSNSLQYARWNGTMWEITTIGSNEFGWFTSLVLDGNDRAHISYLGNHEPSGNQTPKYVFWNGSEWEISVIDEIFSSSGTSLALDATGNPYVSYLNFRELRYAVYTDAKWITETVDIPAQSNLLAGWYSSIAIGDDAMPRISYGLYRSVSDVFPTLPIPIELKYAVKTNGNWVVDVIDGPGETGAYSSLALDAQNRPHIIYFDRGNQAVKYAHWNGNAWVLSVIDTPVQMDGYTSIEIDQNGQLHIAYCDEQHSTIKYAQLIYVDMNHHFYLPVVIDNPQ